MATKKSKFSRADEEKLIDFVKSHEILFNVKHKEFRNTEKKNRLWLELSTDLGTDVDTLQKKWKAIRDYYVRSLEKKTTGSAASSSATSKRDKSLSFLRDTSILKRQTNSSFTATNVPDKEKIDEVMDDELPLEEQSLLTNSPAEDDRISGGSEMESFDGEFTSVSKTSVTKKRESSQMTEANVILHEFLANRPKPSDFLSQKPTDDIQQFCDAMASTVRKFSPLQIAKVKLKISQVVGLEEIAWAEAQAQMQARMFLPIMKTMKQ